MLHPQYSVRRDESGALSDIRPRQLDEVLADDETAESWIHIEIDRDTDRGDLARLQRRLCSVLDDVRAAVEDWPMMRQAAADAAGEVAATHFGSLSAEEKGEAVSFLEWLEQGNFTFLGYREYRLKGERGQESLEVVPGTGLGLLRHESAQIGSRGPLPGPARVRARDPEPLVITKANSRATVHRSTYLDYVGVKVFDQRGEVIGERRFLGLFTASAYAQSVLRIPLLRLMVERVRDAIAYTRDSHGDKDLVQFLETYPRDELFQIPPSELADIAQAVLSLQERRRTRLFMRRDPFERFASCMVYLPRDRYTTRVRRRMERILRDAFGAESVEYTARVTESVLARLHFIVRVSRGAPLPIVDGEQLERRLVAAARSWDDDFSDALLDQVGEEQAAVLRAHYAGSIPAGYQEGYSARTAVADVRHLAQLGPDDIKVNLYRPYSSSPGSRRLKVYRSGGNLSLSVVLPILQRMGVQVSDERPFEMGGTLADPRVPVSLYDFGLTFADRPEEGTGFKRRFEDAFTAAWSGAAEADGFNALVVSAGLTWQQVVLLRAYYRYLLQGGLSFSQQYIESVVRRHPETCALLVRLFDVRFDPDIDDGNRSAMAAEVLAEVRAALDEVTSLDHDRILRALLDAIQATVRTNFFQVDSPGQALAFKVRPQLLPILPKPHPMFEIWVYSPQVEGVHLRFGVVARGGLRWSDRPEDFRTEVLGLVKAQSVKNAVIVPAGAKGGFFPKRLPDPTVDRAGWLEEGKSAYQAFITSLLQVTDNLVAGSVRPPARVVRYDEDDPYLVVAADKGTATFSDVANKIALDHGFWLGDAFASGGSEGYDHKGMGITARGSWESVRFHFRDMGHDTQSQDFTVVGIGDMSGDVFGNGMLLSEHIRLVAAFDHRHIFLDPDPDPAVSFAERRRLFDLPRSSWESYDSQLISPGGGVFSRAAKAVPISEAVARRLGLPLDVGVLTPPQLLQAILKAPVDLLYNGGIGTYVKAESESNLEVGDRANDAIRVDGSQLRCSVVGEGGNLGLTQLGRIEAARHGVRLNTDAIDNSAGVDTSDHEVNLKILVDAAVTSGDMTRKQRNELLRSMTSEVAALVLVDNYDQNVSLANSRRLAVRTLPVHARLMRDLEHRDELDRELEFLPSDEAIAELAAAGEGLSSPELSVLLAYVKNDLARRLAPSRLPDDPYYSAVLRDYFPEPATAQLGDRLEDHALRRDIVITSLVNDMVNHAGATYAFRMQEELGATSVEIVRGYTFTRDVFRVQDLWHRIADLDSRVPASIQVEMNLEIRRLLDRGARWFVQTKGSNVSLQHEVEVHAPIVQELGPTIPDMLLGDEKEQLVDLALHFESQGVPADLAMDVSAVLYRFQLLDVVSVANRTGSDPADVAALYYTLSAHYGVDRLLTRVSDLPRSGRWQTLARQSVRSDLYATTASLTAEVLRETEAAQPPLERLQVWEAAKPVDVGRAREVLEEIDALDSHDLATLSVALRAIRTLLAQSRSSRTSGQAQA